MPRSPWSTRASAPAAGSARELWWLGAFRFTRALAAGLISVAFPYLVLRRYTAVELGFIYSAAALATAALGLGVGFLTDLWGKKRTLVLVGATLPLSAAIAYVEPHLGGMFAAAMIGGYSATGSLAGGGVGGAAQPIQSSVIAGLTRPDRRTFFFSLFAFLSGMVAAAGSLWAGAFPTRTAFEAAAWISLAGLFCLWPMVIEETRGRIRHMPSLKVVGQFSVTGTLNGFSQGLVMPFLIPFFVIVYHLPKSEMAEYAFIGGVLGACTLFLAPFLERQWGFVRAIAITRGIGAGLILLMPFWHLLAVALAVYVLTPALRVAAIPAQQTAITELVTPEERGRALGLNQVTRLGASAGAVSLTGLSFGAADFALPFIGYAAVVVINIGLYFRFFGKTGQPVENEG
ncbi:MAG: MFS transporter [Terriglobales bacterium]